SATAPGPATPTPAPPPAAADEVAPATPPVEDDPVEDVQEPPPTAVGAAGGAPLPPEAAAPATAQEGRPAAPPPPDGGEWRIEVDVSQQRVRVYRGTELVRDMLASTGVPEKPTPLGSFRIQNRGEWFYSRKYRQGGFYWVSFLNWGEYLFHSVPTDADRQIIAEEAARLGQPASHGCVRLSLEDARWLYEVIPAGTPVEIHA
ncbi:MAG: L,D-transpeptidase, partial [Clostridia bacterium]|nr:L,D-transpeptidase [Clostridia bacterium]